MKNRLTFRMNAGIRFNRKLIKGKEFISPGSYEFIMGEKPIKFDFVEYIGTVDVEHPDIVEIICTNPDYSYEDTSDITKEMLSDISAITEFFVFTGEMDETDLIPLELTYLSFELPYEEWEEIVVSEEVLKSAKLVSNNIKE